MTKTASKKSPSENGDWYRLKPRELRLKRTPTWDEYGDLGYTLAEMRGNSPFWIGDFVNHGEEIFGEKYAQVLSVFGEYEYQTVANYASVMRRVPAERLSKPHRKDELYFGHHDAVAKLELKEQGYWLQRAVDEQLSIQDLRDLINPGEAIEREESFREDLNKLILKLQELIGGAPTEARPFLQVALDAMYDGLGEIKKAA